MMTDSDYSAREAEAAALLGDDFDAGPGSDGGTRAMVLPTISIPQGAVAARQPSHGGVLTDAARRFGTERPGDVRYDSPEAFLGAMRDVRARASEALCGLETCHAEERGGDVVLVGSTGVAARTTHYSLGQLAQRTKTPADLLRDLTPGLAASLLSERLAKRGAANGTMKLLFAQHGAHGGPGAGDLVLRAATGPDYGRVWNADVALACAETATRAGFSAPVAFKSAARHAGLDHLASTPGTTATEHALPCAVANDREAFLFLVDYDAQIRVPGYDAPLFRGFFLSNSETGAGSLVWTGFLLDGVCCNLNVWGAREVTEIRLRHTANVHDRTPALYDAARALAQTSAREDEERIRSAQRTLVADTHAAVVSKLFGMQLPGVTKAIAAAAVDVAASTPRYGDPRSVWAVGNGLTEVSQRQAHVGDRATIDRSAGRVFRMAF